ncbi:MAG: phytanoyl-CoA dioxygenase family protein [Myxococcales bacterium]|nr:phytanoyl-CoA dioxygenase family protein [Myxococcales bacterium]
MLPRPTREFVDQTRRKFSDDGFVILPSIFDSERICRLLHAIEQLSLPYRGDFRPIIDKSPLFLDLIDDPAVLPTALALMGGDLHVLTSHVTTIPPGAGPMVWHEDGPRPWSYPDVGGLRPLMLLRLGIFLQDLSFPGRGNLVVVRGSHREPFHHGGDPEQRWAHAELIRICVPPGSAVFFHNALWHTTDHNRQTWPRHAIYFAYGHTWHRPVDWFRPPQTLVEHIQTLPEPRRGLLAQLVGVEPSCGAYAYMFPEPDEFPGISLVEPDVPASGA